MSQSVLHDVHIFFVSQSCTACVFLVFQQSTVDSARAIHAYLVHSCIQTFDLFSFRDCQEKDNRITFFCSFIFFLFFLLFSLFFPCCFPFFFSPLFFLFFFLCFPFFSFVFPLFFSFFFSFFFSLFSLFCFSFLLFFPPFLTFFLPFCFSFFPPSPLFPHFFTFLHFFTFFSFFIFFFLLFFFFFFLPFFSPGQLYELRYVGWRMEVLPCRQPDARVRILVVLVEISGK